MKKNGFPKKLGLMFGIDFLSRSLKSIIQGHADRHTTWYTFVKLWYSCIVCLILIQACVKIEQFVLIFISRFVCFCCFCLCGPWILRSSDGSSLRDITSSPSEVCSRVCNRISRLATFPDWPHSSRQVVLPGNREGSYGQFNPNTTITAVI